MFDDITLEQLMDIFGPLIDTGRLTGAKIYLDGVLIHDDDASEVVDEPTQNYDDEGFSLAVSDFGGVRVEEVDERIAAWIASGDVDLIKAARSTPQYYFVSRNNVAKDARYMSLEQRWQSDQNINWWSFLSGWLGRFVMGAQHFAEGRYEHKESGELLLRVLHLNLEQSTSCKYRKLRDKEWKLGAIPNHAIYAMGLYHHPVHPKYQNEYLSKAAFHILKGMDKRADIIRRQREDVEAGRVRPSPSPKG